MPETQINGTSFHYDRQGDGEPLILIPFLTADHACFAFQLPAYSQHFSCYAVICGEAGPLRAVDGNAR